MRTYTFLHNGDGRLASGGISFFDCADDTAAMAVAERILLRDGLPRVQVYYLTREVGVVRRR